MKSQTITLEWKNLRKNQTMKINLDSCTYLFGFFLCCKTRTAWLFLLAFFVSFFLEREREKEREREYVERVYMKGYSGFQLGAVKS